MIQSRAVCSEVCNHLEQMKGKLVIFVASLFAAILFLVIE